MAYKTLVATFTKPLILPVLSHDKVMAIKDKTS